MVSQIRMSSVNISLIGALLNSQPRVLGLRRAWHYIFCIQRYLTRLKYLNKLIVKLDLFNCLLLLITQDDTHNERKRENKRENKRKQSESPPMIVGGGTKRTILAMSPTNIT
jgi:hypothetical protein